MSRSESEGTPTAPGRAAAGVSAPDASSPPAFPVVGLGASAGGLEALKQLFGHVPEHAGMAFVVVQHLDPERPSLLTNVLGGVTRMPVVEVTSGMRVEADRVHVIPSGFDLGIQRGVLTLLPRQKTGKLHLPIDSFFRSLAEDQHSRAIGVVLSGSGADGTEGLRAVKAEGGITFAQDPPSAQFRSMPESALAAGVVDFRLRPEEIAEELVRLRHHPYVATLVPSDAEAEEARPDEDESFASIVAIVRRSAGIDFSGYKRNTIMRRVERRMALRRTRTLAEYLESLRGDPGEVRSLAQDALIQVTSFFRDPAVFEALQARVFPEILKHKEDGAPVRIWVPGCSTGEEAYSVAICLLESLEGSGRDLSVKLFGSDLSDAAIERARLGLYPESALARVSPERLARYFEHAEGGYRIGKRVRDLCVFVKHDLTRDPPFARLDLISCRNVLIYFDAELQRRVIPLLHYCLARPGYLLLGQSETISGFPDLFAPLDKQNRVYAKKGDGARIAHPRVAGREEEAGRVQETAPDRHPPSLEARRQADHFLLAKYAPPAVIVNDRMEVVQFRGHTGAFLEPAPGQPQTNVLRMARGDLLAHLHEALERAKGESVAVRKDGLRIREDGRARVVDLEVVPLAGVAGSPDRFFLLLFEERAEPPPTEAAPATAGAAATRLPPAGDLEEGRLRTELAATKDYLQSLIGEHQSTTDELAAANEELVAANEELQSTNEELQSAKEELQSTNEELSTVNDELRSRNQELDVTASDLVNVLESVQLPVLIVDMDLRVRRFTPAVQAIASLIPGDVGRPLDDLKLKVEIDDLSARVKEVVGGMEPKEWEVQGQDGHWFRLQIRPYRTTDNRLDGAILSFVDVDVLKRALTETEGARDYARRVVEAVPTALVALDADLRVVSTNPRFRERFALPGEATEGRSLFELGAGVWDVPSVRRAVEDARERRTPFTNLGVTVAIPGIGRKVVSMSGYPIAGTLGAPMLLLALEDITARRAFEEERAQLLASEREARLESERANRTKDLFLATLSHELRSPLGVILLQAQILRRAATGDPSVARSSEVIARAAMSQAKLIDDLLDVSRIVSGKLLLDLGPVDLAAVVRVAVDLSRAAAEAKSLELEVAVDDSLGLLYGDAGRLQQVVTNLLANAIKFTPRGGHVSVRLERTDGRVQLTVADDGLGIRPDVLPQLFNRFVQADSSATRNHGGLGLGLAIVRHLVEVHGGEVHAESAGEGKGSTFRVTLPVGSERTLAAAPATRVATADIAGVRVLLVEDDDDTREACATMLGQLGADVRAAPSAAAGLAMLEGFRPQVILSDIAMPGEDGYDFIRSVRRLDPERGGGVPAAALTALAGEADRRRALEAGFQMHIAKPVDSSRLATAVATLAAWKPAGSGSGPPGP